jgi:biopolymer transport protein ExbD
VRRRFTIPKSTMGVNITSLCDIMLSLLIFFMLVSKKGLDIGADPDLDLPAALRIEGIGVEQLGHSVVINVYPSGTDDPEITTPGRPGTLRTTARTAGGYAEPLAEYLRGVRHGNPDVKVVIYADADLDYRYLEKVLIACANAQIRTVSFAVRRE